MIHTYLLTIGAIMLAMLIYVVTQRVYKLFAQRHPELGPFRREEGKGCGSCTGGSGCSGNSCSSH